MSEAGEARRLEIFTGAGRRRRWSAAAKAQIVAESYGGGTTVSGVARRHGLTVQQLFTLAPAAAASGGKPGHRARLCAGGCGSVDDVRWRRPASWWRWPVRLCVCQLMPRRGRWRRCCRRCGPWHER
ncbi:transposase [Vineibacter terrae]|uniref:transposase n=1 Tax=Vineibacter terrae TaxID=2586908 RepID=UPI001E55E6C5|nr:transposase [Vineibacter terrae]